MSHIVSFKITGLAGRDKPLEVEMNRDINIFFGLNGSGKTSLLKILHAAMANDTDILYSVPFKAAAVKIYSLNWEKEFTRSIEKPSSLWGMKRKRQDAAPRKIRVGGEIVLVREPITEKSMKWSCTPTTPKEASAMHWSHKYLPTSRLHISDEPPYRYLDPPSSTSRPWITEEQLDALFAGSVEHLWSRYSAEMLSAVRTAQEQGLASILRAVLSTQSSLSRRKRKLPSITAYERVQSFLERQGSASILGKKEDFEKRYALDPILQDVVKDIDSVEDKIRTAMSSRDALQKLITRLFMANKEIIFTDESIQVLSKSGKRIGLASLSSGEKHLLRIFVETLLARENSLMIDEPEISMHVDWQKELIKSLRSLNPEAQLIFATHSPEVMADISDDRIFRV